LGARATAVAVAVGLVALGVPAGASTMASAHLDQGGDARLVAFVANPEGAPAADRAYAHRFAPYRRIAAYLDRRHLPPGSVLTDVAFSFAVVLDSTRPGQFVITPDRDFQEAVADPPRFHVRYLLVPHPAGASYDALNVAYPTLYATGAGFATLVRQFPGTDGPTYRLYRVTSAPPGAP
ncbi:MAG: ABC transporter, partial [Acidimicrobiales bacterium]